jgi:hypothetical protein
VDRASDTEIDDLYKSLPGKDDVGWLNVPMDDVVTVSFSEAARNLEPDGCGFFAWQRTGPQLPGQSLTLVVGHDNKPKPVGRIFNSENGPDVGMIKCGRRSRFNV